MYKTITKATHTSWADISRQLYGTPDQASNLEKLNNNTSSGQIMVQDNTVSNKSDSTLEIRLEGDKPLVNVLQIQLLSSLQDIRACIITLQQLNNIKVFDNCTVYYQGEIFLQGIIKNITPVLNGEQQYYVLQVKSLTGLLLDTVVPTPLEYTNSTVQEIIDSITNIYGIQVTYTETVVLHYQIKNEIDNSASADFNETCWQFITRLCNARGLLVRDTGVGLGIGQLTSKTSTKSISYPQQTIMDWLPSYNYDHLARHYEFYSQFMEENSSTTMDLKFIKLPITKRILNDDLNSGVLQNYGQWYIGREIGKAVKLQLTFSGNQTLHIGELVTVQNSLIGLEKPIDFIVERITINYTEQQTIATLTLPCAYTGILPTTLPLL